MIDETKSNPTSEQLSPPFGDFRGKGVEPPKKFAALDSHQVTPFNRWKDEKLWVKIPYFSFLTSSQTRRVIFHQFGGRWSLCGGKIKLKLFNPISSLIDNLGTSHTVQTFCVKSHSNVELLQNINFVFNFTFLLFFWIYINKNHTIYFY